MSQDEEIRAAERRAKADPEAVDVLRALMFKFGRDPFPRELNTPEWRKVFEEEKAIPGVFMEPCRHGSVGTDASDEFRVARTRAPLHRCGHEDPKHEGGIAWSLESVKRIEWRQETWSQGPSFAGEPRNAPSGGLPSLRLVMVYEQHDGCSIHVAATFLDAGGERGYELCGGMSATHCPCPTWTINPETGRPFQGRDVTVGGTARCRCGHSQANHGTIDTLDFGVGQCLPDCVCPAFEPEVATQVAPRPNEET